MSKRKKPEPERKRLDDATIDAMGGIFIGFAEWYRATHDAEGNPIGALIPGFSKPPEQEKEKPE